MSDPVHLRVRCAGSDEADELEAIPVDGDVYRLAANSCAVPLAAGDLVRAVADREGRLQVVDVVAPGDAVLTIFAPTGADGAVEALLDVWELQGAGRTDRLGPFLATAWPGVPMDAVAAQLNADQDAGRGEWILAAEPDERRREAQDEIDFAVT